jgi:hypothetical protein
MNSWWCRPKDAGDAALCGGIFKTQKNIFLLINRILAYGFVINPQVAIGSPDLTIVLPGEYLPKKASSACEKIADSY